MSLDTSCLYSTVKNVSGRAMTFGFLPPHGRKLANNEEFTVFGDIRQALVAGQRGGRAESRRDIMAFEAAIARGDIVIVQTPNPVLQDQNTGASKMLQLDSGTLSAADPCWFNSVS